MPNGPVYVLVLSGSEEAACALAQRRYTGSKVVPLSKRELREQGWKGQLRTLRRLKGEALFIFTDSLDALQEPLLLKWSTVVHGCRETVLADAHGAMEVAGGGHFWTLLPQTLLSAAADALTFGVAAIALPILRLLLRFVPEPAVPSQSATALAFLYAFAMDRSVAGGAMTHIGGFLSGVKEEGERAIVLSARPLPTVPFPVEEVPVSRRWYLFREAVTLRYNLRFACDGRRRLSAERPRMIYQRHGRFLVVGALLSRLLKVPLVLEYNGSEEWTARYWDPARFLPWLRMCERISVAAASLLVVVSEALRQELIASGVPERKILVNPNAADPARFHPGCGGSELRRELRFAQNDFVVGFVGTFSYWHGVAVLEEAIHKLLSAGGSSERPLRFLLIGEGPLAPQMRAGLARWTASGNVIFSGPVPHARVNAYLDVADVLVSPHVPMPDGRPFFGSPTKLFEYMAMQKPIVASDLDQLSRVLQHEETALLVKPGDAAELAGAIHRLMRDPGLCERLGHNARAAVLARHTWRLNAARVLQRFAAPTPAGAAAPIAFAKRSVSEQKAG